MILKISAAVGALALPLFAIAATQGSLSTTSSTGSFVFTANGPASPRNVQVLGLIDPSVTNSNRSERGVTTPGTTVPFCVVDTYGGRLNIAFTTANTGAGSDGFGNLQLKDASNNIVNYRIYLSEFNGTNIAAGSFNNFQTPTGLTVTGSGACGSGNIKAHLELRIYP